MAQLQELKQAIDEGKTAKLRQWRSALHWRVKKEQGFYVKQQESCTNPHGILLVPVKTEIYPTWELLVNSFGYDATVFGWFPTDEPLELDASPERKMAL